MGRDGQISDGLVDAGAGTAMGLLWLGVIPGFLPAVVLSVVLVLPLVAVGLAAALVAAPPYVIWRVASRPRTGPQEQVASLPPLPIAKPHAP